MFPECKIKNIEEGKITAMALIEQKGSIVQR